MSARCSLLQALLPRQVVGLGPLEGNRIPKPPLPCLLFPTPTCREDASVAFPVMGSHALPRSPSMHSAKVKLTLTYPKPHFLRVWTPPEDKHSYKYWRQWSLLSSWPLTPTILRLSSFVRISIDGKAWGSKRGLRGHWIPVCHRVRCKDHLDDLLASSTHTHTPPYSLKNSLPLWEEAWRTKSTRKSLGILKARVLYFTQNKPQQSIVGFSRNTKSKLENTNQSPGTPLLYFHCSQ